VEEPPVRTWMEGFEGSSLWPFTRTQVIGIKAVGAIPTPRFSFLETMHADFM
jgi:hypothetical protein